VPGISDTEILLGADVILSGALGAVYATIPGATKAYFDYVNDKGGVCGRKIVYRMEDNYDDPAKALEAARKLVEKDKVFAMVGSLGDHPHAAVWGYLSDQGVPDLFISAGAHRFGADPQGHPWTVQMIPSYTVEGTFFGEYISQNLPDKKVAVLFENDPFGIDGLAGVKNGLDPARNKIVSEQSYEAAAVDIRSQLTNMKNAGAEVLVLYSTPGFTAQVINGADRLGWHPEFIASYVNSDDMMFQFVSPDLLKGLITFQAYKLAAWTEDPAVAEHYRIMRDYSGPSPTNFTLYGQSIGEMAVEALNRSCDNLTRKGLMEAVESIKDFHSPLLLDGVNISFSDTDHTALQTGRMLRATVKDGKGRFEYFGPVFEFQQ